MDEAWKRWEGHVIHGEFPLQRYMGGSNYGAVFVTQHPDQPSQPAAIKLVHGDAPGMESQLSQWMIAENLSHPYLIRLLRTGRSSLGEATVYFAVMEYAEENLAEILPERPLRPDEISDMLGPILEALSYLHGQGLVHGCLKPANILAANDQLKLSSDGILRIGSGVPDCRRGVYDAPEANQEINTASDVWSLGIALTEALTQRRPESVPSVREDGTGTGTVVAPDNLPEPFLGIIHGCLQDDPASRLKVSEIAERLGAAKQPMPAAEIVSAISQAEAAKPVVPIVPASLPPEASRAPKTTIAPPENARPARRSALPAVVTAAAVIVLAGVFAGWKLLAGQPEVHQEIPATAVQAAAVQPPNEQPASTSNGDRRLDSSSLVSPGPDSSNPKSSGAGALEPSAKAEEKPTPSEITTVPADKPSPSVPSAGGSKSKGSASPSADLFSSSAPSSTSASLTAISTNAPTNTAMIDNPGEGDVTHEILPMVSQKAQGSIQGTIVVTIKTQVSPAGNVVQADFDSPGSSKYFSRIAMQAAQKWKFIPAEGNPNRGFLLRFEFRSDGTKAAAKSMNP